MLQGAAGQGLGGARGATRTLFVAALVTTKLRLLPPAVLGSFVLGLGRQVRASGAQVEGGCICIDMVMAVHT